MAAFRYSFQKIVDLKSSEKTQAEWLLSSALGELQSEELSLRQLQEEREVWERNVLENAQSSTSLAELQLIQQYIEFLDESIARKLAAVKRAQKSVELKRMRLSDTVKDEKVWLKAKDRALERFRYDMQLKEQNELDEFATVRYITSAP
ncbi:flagellar export protein FliJ [Paenibacillus protaetiae]|uniref:Flagellar FliJ protein n=1 Tax=Paenibacillus protaetiae TaxID=2509456 RepID=A0A4V0YEW2_9BACL|nr:flagellar export protein FliJ [Paenibacillus protaetiae]QAY65601.1 flagellar export protein FliJ [Paenibacillus protaetiae]